MKKCSHKWRFIEHDFFVCLICQRESHWIWTDNFYFRIITLDIGQSDYGRMSEFIKDLKLKYNGKVKNCQKDS
jgi:hypothetical protein